MANLVDLISMNRNARRVPIQVDIQDLDLKRTSPRKQLVIETKMLKKYQLHRNIL